MIISPNDTVRVKLTDTGKRLLVSECDRINDELRSHPRCLSRSRVQSWDADGWCTDQLHVFLSVLGPHFHMGAEMPFTHLEKGAGRG